MKIVKRLRKIGRRQLCFALAAAMLLMATSCATRRASGEDVLTQKATEPGRTQITVLVKNAFSIYTLEKAVEEKFPDIDLVQVGNFSRDMGIEEYTARMEHDDLTDIVMTWPLDVGEEYWADRLIDLSGMEFSSRYNISMLNNIARDGALYYLPGPAQVRGILYNKTLFEENGWEVPQDFEGFLSLCKTIESTGIRAIQLGFANGEVLDTAFVGYNYGNYFSSPQDVQWFDEYNAGQGSFDEHFDGALDVFRQMVDAGVWKMVDLTRDYSERETMFFTRKCAMAEDSVLMARLGYERSGTTDEFALMPFFNPGEDNDWARLYMVCYVGLNKHLEEPENKSKYEKVLKLMDYISTPEGQENLAADTGAMFSSLMGTEPPDIPEIQDLLSALSHGRYGIFPTLHNAQNALRKGLAGLLTGELSKEDVARMVDEENRTPMVQAPPEVLGTATADFTLPETGAYLCDAMRAWSGAELALFLDNGKDGLTNSKGLCGRIYQGDITVNDISRIMPDLKSGDTGKVWITTMTGAVLLKNLEHSVQVENIQGNWFYYASGLNIELDPTAPSGSRIKKVTTTDGKELDQERVYTVAVTDGSVMETGLLSCEKTQMPAAELFAQTVREAGEISPAKDGRFRVVK